MVPWKQSNCDLEKTEALIAEENAAFSYFSTTFMAFLVLSLTLLSVHLEGAGIDAGPWLHNLRHIGCLCKIVLFFPVFNIQLFTVF